MFVEAVGFEPTKAEWRQIYSLLQLTAVPRFNFFCFVEKSRIELLTTKFSVWHSTTELLLHFFLLPHKDSNLDNNGSEPLALPLCYKAIIAESHGFEPYALTCTFCLANKSVSLTVALSIYWRKGENSMLKLEQTCLFVINFLLQPTTAFQVAFATVIHCWAVHKRKFGSTATYFFAYADIILNPSSSIFNAALQSLSTTSPH